MPQKEIFEILILLGTRSEDVVYVEAAAKKMLQGYKNISDDGRGAHSREKYLIIITAPALQNQMTKREKSEEEEVLNNKQLISN